jgi:hypothetical protein
MRYNDILVIPSSGMLSDKWFQCPNKDTYPPFKNGLYLEEYFYKTILEQNPTLRKKYIPAKWTNFQIESWFRSQAIRKEMQSILNDWISENPSPNGYFTLVQHDDGVQLQLPENTTIYGASEGHIPIPLIYQDVNNTLESYPRKTFREKTILCSFVGNITSNHVLPNVREVMVRELRKYPQCKLINSGGWTASVNENLQRVFIEITRNSKFALAPRGYGRSSFRFFECFQLGTIPIYIWNDFNWLPFQDTIDYSKLCICIHISEIESLVSRLESISDTEYTAMLAYYETIKHLFQLEGMTEHILREERA